jgi:hypothetical protein
MFFSMQVGLITSPRKQRVDHSPQKTVALFFSEPEPNFQTLKEPRNLFLEIESGLLKVKNSSTVLGA